MSTDTDLDSLPTIQAGLYRHYKGGEYQVLGTVRHSETLETMVLYRALYGAHGLWVRPYAMFTGSLEVDGQLQQRFRCIAPDPA